MYSNFNSFKKDFNETIIGIHARLIQQGVLQGNHTGLDESATLSCGVLFDKTYVPNLWQPQQGQMPPYHSIDDLLEGTKETLHYVYAEYVTGGKIQVDLALLETTVVEALKPKWEENNMNLLFERAEGYQNNSISQPQREQAQSVYDGSRAPEQPIGEQEQAKAQGAGAQFGQSETTRETAVAETPATGDQHKTHD